MRDCVDAFEVLQPVVSPVMVFMVNLEAVWDWAARRFPNEPMVGDDAPVIEFNLNVSIAADPADLYKLFHKREIGLEL